MIALFPSKHYDVKVYPAVENYLISAEWSDQVPNGYGKLKLEQTGQKHIINGKSFTARKLTRNKWFETQDQIGYWDDFSKHIIAWQRITQQNTFCLTENGMLVLDSLAFLSNIEEDKYWLCAFLNSNLIFKWMRWNVHEYGESGFRLANQYVEVMPIPKPNNYKSEIEELLRNSDYKKLDSLIYRIYRLTNEEIAYIEDKI